MKKYLKFFARLGIKTVYFNFHYLPFRQAIRFPFLISKNVYFRKLKGEIFINCPLQFGLIQIGFGDVGIFDDKNSRTILEVFGTITFNGKTNIGHGSKISVRPNASLNFGNNFAITAETSIVCYSNIVFGDDCLLSWDNLIMDSDIHKILDSNENIMNKPKPIVIGDKVWIGCRCLILKGANIPNNCIIGANTVLNKTLDKSNALYGGNPIKLLKENVSWHQ